MSQRKAKEYRRAMEQYRGVVEDVDDLKRRIGAMEARHRREDQLEEIRRRQARREAEGLARGEAEAALCANACLLARALERGGQPVFADGGAALAGLSAREIGALAGRWAAFDRAENPSPEDGEERLEGLKKAWSTRPMSAFAGVCSNALARFRRRSGPNR